MGGGGMTSLFPLQRIRGLQLYTRATSVWALFLGGMMVCVWLPLFPQTHWQNVATLNPKTGLGFVLAGVALWVIQIEAATGQGEAPRSWVTKLCAATLVLTGLLTIGRHVFALESQAERILAHKMFRILEAPTLGRMEINTALNSILLGTALALIEMETRKGVRPAQLFALGAALVGFLGIVGYVDGARPQDGIAAYSLGLVTAATFVSLSCAVLLIYPDRGLMQVVTSRGVGGVMVRRVMIYILILTVVLAALDQVGERLGLYKTRLDSFLFMLSLNGLLTVLIWLHARSLNRIDMIRYETEAKVERSRAMLAQAEQLAHLGSWEWDLKTRQFSCSEELNQIFGLTEAGLDGGHGAHMERIHAGDRDRALLLFEGALPDGMSIAKNVRVLRPDGPPRIVTLHARVLTDDRGQPTSVLGACLDVTDFVRSEEGLRAFREQLRAFSARLQRAREEERMHIAREIHDELGSVLTALKMDVSLLAEQVRTGVEGLPGGVVAELESIASLIDKSIRSVQDIATELRPTMLDDLGLQAAIEWHAKEFQDRFRIRCVVQALGGDLKLDRDRATTVFRIFQEVLTNVARHAGASEVRVSLQRDEKALRLRVWDNGRGASKREVNDAKSLGVLGMRERAMLVGGSLLIRGREGKGTVVSLRVPLGKPVLPGRSAPDLELSET